MLFFAEVFKTCSDVVFRGLDCQEQNVDRMNQLKQWKKTSITILISIACAICGYGFYAMNKHDVINAIAFGIGLTGIMLSFLRNYNQPKN